MRQRSVYPSSTVVMISAASRAAGEIPGKATALTATGYQPQGMLPQIHPPDAQREAGALPPPVSSRTPDGAPLSQPHLPSDPFDVRLFLRIAMQPQLSAGHPPHHEPDTGTHEWSQDRVPITPAIPHHHRIGVQPMHLLGDAH